MEQLLKNFRDKYLEQLLSFTWRQWSALGVAGYGETKDNWVIDPEALLLFTCNIGRYEPRMFDEVLDWLNTNGEVINIQRLNRIIRCEQFSGVYVLSTIADFMSQHDKSLKWKRLSHSRVQESTENLFYLKDGSPIEQFGKPEKIFIKHGFTRGRIELRKHTQPVRIIYNTGFLFKLRALFGINARCEIILYLLTHESAHPSRIAREIYYSQKRVQDTLIQMTQSGLIRVRPVGKEKHYWLNSKEWFRFLKHEGKPLQWINWPLLLSAIEQVWIKLNDRIFLELEPLMQSSELRVLMKTIRHNLETAGFARALSDDTLYLGEEYLSVFLSDIEKIIE